MPALFSMPWNKHFMRGDPSIALPRTEQAPHAVPSPVDLANATCSVQTDPTAVCVPS